MDKFEHQFETLDVQTQQMEDTMSNTTTLTTPQVRIIFFFKVILNFVSKCMEMWFSPFYLLRDIAAAGAFSLLLCAFFVTKRILHIIVTRREDHVHVFWSISLL